jgi:hypothetical protein
MFWPDADTKPDPVALETWRKEQVQREEARKRSAELALANLAQHRIWEQYHLQLAEHGRFLWRRRGVCDSLQDFWQLGYDKAHVFWREGHEFQAETLAIPIFGYDWSPLNIKHRLTDPPEGFSKYRYECRGITDGLLWRADPDTELTGRVVAIEGEIKAMVTAERAGQSSGQIVGLPGTNPASAIIRQLQHAERVTLVMDPDAKGAGIKLAKALGLKRCWLLIPPRKIDDGILAADMNAREVTMMLRSAIRLSAYVTGAK